MLNKSKIKQQESIPYEIRIKGELDEHWADWFGNTATVSHEEKETRIKVAVVDQAQLHGLLKRIRDLGVTLISVTIVTPS